jgi:predicted nucleic acid-binding protein
MALEAARILGKPQGPVVKFLKGHLDEVRRLTGFRQAIDDLCIGQLRLLTISPALVPTIAALSQQIGLLTNDAAVVALMQANGLSKIASLDADFDRVPGSRAAPRRNHPAGRPGAGRCQPLTGGVSQPEAEMGPGAMRRLASSLPTPSSFKPVAQERWPGCPLGLWAGPSPWSARSNRARMASPPA